MLGFVRLMGVEHLVRIGSCREILEVIFDSARDFLGCFLMRFDRLLLLGFSGYLATLPLCEIGEEISKEISHSEKNLPCPQLEHCLPR